MLEKMIAQHCAPALAGIKTANLVSCSKTEYKNLDESMQKLNRDMNRRGIFFKKMCECKNRVLVLVYREKKLSEYLERREIKQLLSEYGYDGCKSVDDYINRLKIRLKRPEFPHEIGAFLGYPAHDIYGYINNQPCLLVGDWRVYKDKENAQKLFERYKRCKMEVVKRIESGRTLSQMFCAA